MSQLIIDTHQHLWNLDRVAYPWLVPAFGPIARTFEPAELEPQLAPAGVTHTVLVQSANSYADTEYMFEMAAAYPWISGVVGWVPLLFPDVAGRAIERFKKNPLFRGVRHLIHNEADPKWLLQAEVIEGLKLLADAGLTFDVVATLPEHMECIPVICEKVPNLKMVIDHLGQPPIATRRAGAVGRRPQGRGREPERLRQDLGPGHGQRQLGWLDRRRRQALRRLRHRDLRPGPLHGRRRLAGVGAGGRLRQGVVRVPLDPGGLSGGCADEGVERDSDPVLRVGIA